MARYEDRFPSTEGTTEIFTRLWCAEGWEVPGGYLPDAHPSLPSDYRPSAELSAKTAIPAPPRPCPDRPVGIVQLVHGMTEYVDRYDHVARYLNSRGFIVVGNDHLAHGLSVTYNDRWGRLEIGKGAGQLVEDVHRLRTITQERFGVGLPYFFWGHSMGSFIVRNYLPLHQDGVAGAIICGTGQMRKNTASFGRMLALADARMHGQDHRSVFLGNLMFGSYNKRFEPARTKQDWLTRDTDVVDTYCADPMCTFLFSSGADVELMQLILDCIDPGSFARTRDDLPLLLVSGGQDPVGNYGDGPAKATDLYRESGCTDVTLRIFERDRHEIHNERDKDEVLEYLGDWLCSKAGGSR